MSYDYDAIVIGAGPGGYPCGIRLGALGKKTLVIEKEFWGGVCLNVGCIPSKALITAAKRVEEIKHAGLMGITVSGDVKVDMKALQAWKGNVVSQLTGGVGRLLDGNKAERLVGEATIAGPNTVKVKTAEGEKTLTAANIVVATGSSPIQVPGFAFADGPVLDSTKALALEEIPEKLVVIGGGYIGLEMGSMFAKLGTQVTVVEMMDALLPGFDPEVVRVVERKLKKDGVQKLLKTKALGWEKADKGIIVHVETPEGKQDLAADYVLVTVGRRPNTKGIGLENAGVQLDGPFIKVDKQLRTNVPSIFAIGDVAGQPMLAHKATHEGEVVAEVIAGHKVQYDAKVVPAVVFTDPEVAIVGLDEAAAKAKGDVKIGKVPFAAIGRALTTGESDGFIKVIIDAKTHLIVGVTIVGHHASDLIAEATLAIEMSAEARDMGLTIHAHPTLSEGLMEAAKHALGEAVHVMNKVESPAKSA